MEIAVAEYSPKKPLFTAYEDFEKALQFLYACYTCTVHKESAQSKTGKYNTIQVQVL